MTPNTHLAIDTFLPYMRDVVRCEQSLHELNLMWRMIESSAKMNCPVEARTILPTMAATRAGFNRLEKELVHSLVHEKVANALTEIGTKAQYVIDIVVRNLYERTADVGLLATDRELCAFVAGQHADQDRIRARLRAYRNKYTVYDEIMLLDTEGNVLVQIDEHSPVEGSLDPLIGETLHCATYVETFRFTDLRPTKKHALVYSRRMLHPDTGTVIGVLCLCFNFEQEMAGIFHSHRDPSGRTNLLLLDEDNRIIESADPLWMPLGAVVPVNRNAEAALMMFGGREYLVRTFSAEGYQGYLGPAGWQGQAMMPVDVAFNGASSQTLSTLDPEVASGLLSHAHSFCPPLYEIMSAAETIRRVVWNGQVMTAGQRGELQKLQSILEQISETGIRSNELFAHSIGDLYETVLASSLRDSEFVSHLLVDLLDRNLYERSDDCRWWALTPELRVALAAEEQDVETVTAITEILAYINQLYTVYTRIFVYDANGRIIACSNDDTGASVCGMRIDSKTLDLVRALRTEQDYHVTPFVPNQLYDNAPTYVYHAAIRDPDQASVVVGGIGIVFDAAPEFSAMLRGGLSKKDTMSALFIDRQGRIISSTDPQRQVGSMLDIDPALLTLPNGSSTSRIVIHDGHYAILGCTVSHGYREFKVSDGYREDVLAIVYASFGEVRVQGSSGSSRSDALLESNPAQTAGREFATFFVDSALFAVDAVHVLQASPASEIGSVSTGGRAERIGVIALRHEGEAERFIWVFDLGYLLRGTPSARDSTSQVIMVRHEGHTVGLLVTELHAVPQFDPAQIVAAPFAGQRNGMLVTDVIKANHGRLLIQLLNVGHMFSLLRHEPDSMIKEITDARQQGEPGMNAFQSSGGDLFDKAA